MLQLSTKIRYAVRALIEIAKQESDEPVMISFIAEKQDISVKYLENIMSLLKTAGIVRSVRGKNGGYLLVEDVDKISVYDVIKAVEGPVSIAPCSDSPKLCKRSSHCVATNLWQEITKYIQNRTKEVSIGELIKRERRHESS